MKKLLIICVAALGLAGCNSTGYYYDSGYDRRVVYSAPRAPIVVPPTYYYQQPSYYPTYTHRQFYNPRTLCYNRTVRTPHGIRREQICR